MRWHRLWMVTTSHLVILCTGQSENSIIAYVYLVLVLQRRSIFWSLGLLFHNRSSNGGTIVYFSALDPMHRRNIETHQEKEVGKQSDATQRRNVGGYIQVLSLLYIIPVEYWAPWITFKYWSIPQTNSPSQYWPGFHTANFAKSQWHFIQRHRFLDCATSWNMRDITFYHAKTR